MYGYKILCEISKGTFEISHKILNPYTAKCAFYEVVKIHPLKQILSILVEENQFNWDDHIPYILMAYRASVHKSTKCTPNLLMLNREINLPVYLMCGSPPETPECPVEYAEWVRQAMQHAFDFVRKNLQASTERHKTLYNQNSGSPSFDAAESVWRFYPPIAKKKFGKRMGWPLSGCTEG